MATFTVSLFMTDKYHSITARTADRLLYRRDKQAGKQTCKQGYIELKNKAKFYADFKHCLNHHKTQLSKATQLSCEILNALSDCKEEKEEEFLQDTLSSINNIIYIHSTSYECYKQKLGY